LKWKLKQSGKRAFVFLGLIVVLGCANKNCREMRLEESQKSGAPIAVPAVDKEKDPMNKTALADRVRVYKPDGSLQCGMGKAVPLDVMQKQLGSIRVHKSFSKNDGLMRIQVCGTATGNSNVYEIDRTDLAEALKAGFKEWTYE
jgi:hypothetical protein